MSSDSSSSNGLSEYIDLSDTSVKGMVGGLRTVPNRFGGKLTYLYLAIIMVFMAGVRLLPWDVFVRPEQVYLSGNDGWYHFRQSMYVAEHWPSTMPYDLLTGYPVGINAGTFGSLFDQIVGTLALIIGFGNPSQDTVLLTLALTTVAFAVLCVIPVYFITREISTKNTGVLAATILALFPSLFLTRSLIGNGDHQMAEAFFILLAVSAFFTAFRVAQRNILVLETLTLDTIRDATTELKYTVLAGLSIGAYLLVWTPGIIFFAALAVFFALYAIITEYSDKHFSEPVLLVGGISLVLPGLLVATRLDSMTFEAAGYTLLQVAFPIATALGCWVLIGLTRLVESRDLSSHTVPAVTVAATGITTLALYVGLPAVFDKLWFNLKRTLLMQSGDQTLTISEAQQFVSAGNFFQPLYNQYGLMFFVGIFGFAILSVVTVMKYRRGESFSQNLFLLVFGVFITLMAFTQVRFNYYLAPFTAIFAAYGVFQSLDLTNITDTSVPNLSGYQVITLLMVVMVFVPGLLYPVSGTAVSTASNVNSAGAYTAWEGTLEWTEENTADPGIEPYGTYQNTETPYADQAPEAYGMVSWWDYGHWITTTAERSPVSNPFQQHATESAEYLLAENETEAEEPINNLSATGESDTRYVYVDWQMVNSMSKFTAPVTWHPDLQVTDMLDPVYLNRGSSVQTATYLQSQRYYESLMVKLYRFHGSQANPGPVVVDYNQTQVPTQNGGTGTAKTFELGPTSSSGIYKFDSVRAAQQYVQNKSTAQLGGVGNHPREQVDAVEHYRLVKTSQTSALESRMYQQTIQRTAQFEQTTNDSNASLQLQDFTMDPSWVKMFENVEGATVQGSGAPANTTVTITIPMYNPAQGTTFSYTQTATTDENGNFEYTVPYSTTGYENWGPEEGYGNVEVKATDTAKIYTVQQTIEQGENDSMQVNQTYYAAETHIPEGAVLGETDSPITVELEQMSQEEIQELFERESSGNESLEEPTN